MDPTEEIVEMLIEANRLTHESYKLYEAALAELGHDDEDSFIFDATFNMEGDVDNDIRLAVAGE